MIDENYKLVRKLYITAFILFGLGTVLGALYYVNKCGDSGDIKNYMDIVSQNIKSGINRTGVTRHAAKTNAITLTIFTASAFFRFGGAIIAAEIGRRGFISGFTSAAYICSYGASGIIAALSAASSMILFLPALMLFSAVNGAITLKKFKLEKKFIIFYLIFLIAVITIFCVSSFFEGYISTIFMKWSANLMT